MIDDKNVLSIYEVKKATSDIKDIKQELKENKEVEKEHEKKINNLEKKQAVIEQKLDTIIKNTERTNNNIQNAIFGAVATGLIGGGIAIIWAFLGGG